MLEQANFNLAIKMELNRWNHCIHNRENFYEYQICFIQYFPFQHQPAYLLARVGSSVMLSHFLQ